MTRNICVLLVLAGCLAGCATYKANAKFETYFQAPKTIVVLRPDIRIDQVTAGGVRQYRDDYSVQAEENVWEQSLKILQDVQNVRIKKLDVSGWTPGQVDALNVQTAAFEPLALTIIGETYASSGLKKKKTDQFDYTMGPEVSSVAAAAESDALLFTFGNGEDFTKGRHAANFFKTLAVSVATYGMVYMAENEKKWLGAALIDGQTGEVIWFNYTLTGDVKNSKAAATIVKSLYKTFPKKVIIRDANGG